MKNNLMYWVVFMVLVVNTSLAQDNWTQKANFNGPRGHAVGFSIGNLAYVGTGYDDAANYYQDIWAFNPSANTWTQKADFPGGPRYGSVGFSIAGKGFLGTGVGPGSIFYKDFWEYDPSLNSWTEKSDFGGATRYLATGFSVGNKGYIGTGSNLGTYYSDFWEYDPALNSWTKKADLPPQGRHMAGGMGIGDKGYIGFGMNSSSARQKDFWAYDPLSNSWNRKSDLPSAERYGPSTFSLNGKGYVASGFNFSGLNDFWEYDTTTDTWTSRTAVSAPGRTTGVGLSIGNKGYIGLGSDGTQFLNDFWEFTPEVCDVWTQMPDFPDIGRSGSVAVGIGSKGYMGLGAGDNGYYKDLWEYDPIQKTWTQKSDFPGAGRQAGVAFSTGSKMYAGTGIINRTPYSDIYEYDPAANSWTRKADYGGGARYAAMAFSIGNKGYIGAGKDAGVTYGTTDFWEYNPATDIWTRKADVGNIRRSTGVGFSVGNKGYIGMGFQDYDTRLKDLWEYDPGTDIWSRKADLPGIQRWSPVAFSIGNLGYVGEGYYYSPLNDMWQYNPSTDTWTQIADVGQGGRGQGIGFSIGNKGYVGFGYNNTGNLNDLWEYIPAVILNCPPLQILCYDTTHTYSIPPVTAIGNCGIPVISYNITGSTNRSGNGENASGLFNPGSSIIHWIAINSEGSSSNGTTGVFVNNPITVMVPDVYAVNPGGNANTIYIGYGPTSLTLSANVTGGYLGTGGQYKYSWSTGATTASIDVSPSVVGEYNYIVNITDDYGCTATASKSIVVVDVRSGNKLDKVLVCQVPPGNPVNFHEVSINKNDVNILLKNGSYLGKCSGTIKIGNKFDWNSPGTPEEDLPALSFYPNPNHGAFTLIINYPGASELRIMNQNGKLVYRKTLQPGESKQIIPVNIGSVSKGMYFFEIMGNQGTRNGKMVID